MNVRLQARLHKRPTPVESPVMAVVELVAVLTIIAVYAVGLACLVMP